MMPRNSSRRTSRRRGKRRTRSSRTYHKGRGSYNTTSVKRRRAPTNPNGRGIGSALKGLAKFAAKNAPTILKGARFLAKKTGNETIQNIANSRVMDTVARNISKKYGGRGVMKKSSVKRQAKTVIAKMKKLYGDEGTRKIIRSYLKTEGRGAVGNVLGGILSTIFPF